VPRGAPPRTTAGVYVQDESGRYGFYRTAPPTVKQLHDIHSHSVTYRVAIGPQKGRKVFCLQTLPPQMEASPDNARVAKLNGFSLHTGIAAKAHQRDKVERLCLYIDRPAIAEQRLSLTPTGKVRYELKTPFRNGTTDAIFEPFNFISRLAALVRKPRVNLVRFHGVSSDDLFIILH